MYENATGTEIVASIADGRPWWKLRSGDIKPWIDTLHPAATERDANQTGWIGASWDGTSDLAIGSDLLSATDIREFVDLLEEALRQGNLAHLSVADVRHSYGHSDMHSLVVDLDFGDFILPVAIDENMNWGAEDTSLASFIPATVTIAAHADKVRGQFLRRELRLRKAIETVTAELGGGVAPLWLRLDPFPVYERPKYITGWRYVVLVVRPDENLVWAPTGAESIDYVKDMRDYYSWSGRVVRPRLKAIARHNDGGSAGEVTEVALAIIRQAGLDPQAVFAQARQARLDDRRGSVEVSVGSLTATLRFTDGVLGTAFHFDGGFYSDGRLILDGCYPATLALAARGRELSAFVDHPVFVETGVKASSADHDETQLRIQHAVRLVPIELVRDEAASLLAA